LTDVYNGGITALYTITYIHKRGGITFSWRWVFISNDTTTCLFAFGAFSFSLCFLRGGGGYLRSPAGEEEINQW
jgi:hypothetical protein